MNSIPPPPTNVRQIATTPNRRVITAILAVLIGYQALMYGLVMRVTLHLTVVLIPWLLRQPGYRLFDTINLGYTPAYLWFESALAGIIPDPQWRIRLQMIVFTALVTILVYSLARRWWGRKIGLLAAALYAVWGPTIMDYLIYLEMFLGILALCALVVWDNTAPTRFWRPLLAGVCIGMAVMVKQHGIALIIVFVVWRLTSPDRSTILRDLGWLLVGFVVPILLGLTVIASQGLLGSSVFAMLGSFTPYTANYELPSLSEIVIFILWVSPAILFGLLTVFRRDSWGRQPILLIGLLLALLTPVIPRYGRFHLAGAVPLVALIGAGLVFYFLRLRETQPRIFQYARVFSVITLLFALIALVLPTYYRLKLGAQTSQYDALVDLSAQVKNMTSIGAGQRAWILPNIDPTSNFYAVSGDLPPKYWTEDYPWIWQESPTVETRMIQGLDADPPAIAIVIDHWRDQIPSELNTYLSAHYTPVGHLSVGEDIQSPVTLYRKNP